MVIDQITKANKHTKKEEDLALSKSWEEFSNYILIVWELVRK